MAGTDLIDATCGVDILIVKKGCHEENSACFALLIIESLNYFWLRVRYRRG